MRMSRLFSLMALAMLAGCATGGGSAFYRKEVGQATALDAKTLAEQVITRYGYTIDSFEEEPEIRIQTHWRHRLPFEDEAAVGITAAESRIVVVARPRSYTDERGAYYNIYFMVENRLGVAGEPAWNSTLNTPQFRAYADSMAEDFKSLLMNIGVRRHGGDALLGPAGGGVLIPGTSTRRGGGGGGGS